jgi:hypothetical protein
MNSTDGDEPKRNEVSVEKPDDSILLKDLAPREEVKGGGGKLRFGESPIADSTDLPRE